MTKIGKKAAQDFVCTVSKVFDRVKTVALWSAKKIQTFMLFFKHTTEF
jgi:hypothetical protein